MVTGKARSNKVTALSLGMPISPARGIAPLHEEGDMGHPCEGRLRKWAASYPVRRKPTAGSAGGGASLICRARRALPSFPPSPAEVRFWRVRSVRLRTSAPKPSDAHAPRPARKTRPREDRPPGRERPIHKPGPSLPCPITKDIPDHAKPPPSDSVRQLPAR